MTSTNIFFLASLLASTSAGASEDPLQPGISWRTDLDAARRDAISGGRPLLVVFR